MKVLKKSILSILAAMFLFSALTPVCFAKNTSAGLKCLDLDENGVLKVQEIGWNESKIIEYTAQTESEVLTLSVKSSDPSVVTIPKEYKTVELYADWGYSNYFYFTPVKPGTAAVIITLNDETLKIPVVVCAPCISDITAVNSGIDKVKLKWDQVPEANGYIIKKSTSVNNLQEDTYFYPTSGFKSVKYISGAKNCSAKLSQKWDETAAYFIQPYIEYNGHKYIPDAEQIYRYSTVTFKKPRTGVEISGVKKTADKTLQISWKNAGSSYSYKLYRSTDENNGYKLIKDIAASTKETITVNDKVSKGVTYYYKLVTVKSGKKSVKSASVSGFIPIKSELKVTNANFLSNVPVNQYGWNWADSDDMYYYAQNGAFHIVNKEYDSKNDLYVLKIYTLNSKFKADKKKTVKLPANSFFGGFYQAYDGNSYVVVGYNNPKESKKKTVISVIKYSSNWEKLGTANIKGGASNIFTGIYSPFDAGNVRMDLNGTKLYLYTARTMFALDDGLHHQSNIAFEIDTKTVKAKEKNINYTSHSFNQFVRFQNGNIYLCDHGDAYARGVCVTLCNNYGKSTMTQNELIPLVFDGDIGDNYTGATVCGMEVGKTNVVTVGTSVAHKDFKLNGKTGGNRNLYVIITNKTTGKSTVKWLTKYESSNSDNYVQEARMVKITDDCFAVLYSVTNGKTGKSIFHCMYINNSGTILKNKTYKNVTFNCGTQPILYKGYITFADEEIQYDPYESVRKIYRIPASW